MIRSWRFVITSESKARITRRPLSAMSWVWGWRDTNRAGGKVASITTWPVGTRPMTSGVWFSLSPPAVPITLTNTTAEATTTIATTGTNLEAVDTTDAVMAEIVANRALRGHSCSYGASATSGHRE